jgi:hypothetical protein
MNTPTEGKPTSLMQPQPLKDMHPFTPTLKKWRHGITVDCGPDWSWDIIETAIERGPHPSACTPKALALFEEDTEYQQKAGFSMVIIPGRHQAALSTKPQDLPRGGNAESAGIQESSWIYPSWYIKRPMELSPPRRPASMTLQSSMHQWWLSRKLERCYHDS